MDTTKGRIDYTIDYLTLGDRVFLVLIAKGGSASMSSGPPASGTLVAPDGRRIGWRCDTPNGKNGVMKIGQERFELEKGAVFLVHQQEGRTTVEQLAIDMDQLQGGDVEARLEAVAEWHERLACFLELCKTPR
jgi:hypothetical protein